MLEVATDVQRAVGKLKKEKAASNRTVQAYLTAVKSFTRWLVHDDRLVSDPLAGVRKPNPCKDVKLKRRALLHEEWWWLRGSAEHGPELEGLKGAERALLYAVALQTGLRINELDSLTVGQLHLTATPPYLLLNGCQTKNANAARQFLNPDVAQPLLKYIDQRPPEEQVFPLTEHARLAKAIRADLAKAREMWLDEAKSDPAEMKKRMRSDFLLEVNHEGGRLDFHALRHTCGAWLAMNGVNVKVVQEVMRHSTITLTMDTYGHLFPGKESDAIASMPPLLAEAKNVSSRRSNVGAA